MRQPHAAKDFHYKLDCYYTIRCFVQPVASVLAWLFNVQMATPLSYSGLDWESLTTSRRPLCAFCLKTLSCFSS